jgi:hypothetical protein
MPFNPPDYYSRPRRRVKGDKLKTYIVRTNDIVFREYLVHARNKEEAKEKMRMGDSEFLGEDAMGEEEIDDVWEKKE